MTSESGKGTQSCSFILRAGCWMLVILLIAALGMMPFSLFSFLFSPSEMMLWGVAGFAVSMLATVVFGENLRRLCPLGLVGSRPSLRRLQPLLKRTSVWIGRLGFLTLVLFIWAGLPGTNVGEGPVFQRPGPYEMNNHGRVTTVSRARYLTAGVSGYLALHLVTIALAAAGLRTILFGEKSVPIDLGKDAERTPAA